MRGVQRVPCRFEYADGTEKRHMVDDRYPPRWFIMPKLDLPPLFDPALDRASIRLKPLEFERVTICDAKRPNEIFWFVYRQAVRP